MAIKIVTGVPGSGKTYFVVREVISKNYRFSKTYGEWVPKDLSKKFTIVTNVAGLRLPHVKLDDLISELGYKSHRQLFTLNGIKPVQRKYGYLVIIIDEAQGFFPKSFRDNSGCSNGEDNNNSVFYFFEKHRHEGIDLYLCAQLYKRLNPDIADLCEYHIHAVRRSFSIRGEFKYKIFLGGQQIDSIKFPFHKRIGALYKTVQVEEELQGKKVSPWRKYIVWGFALILFLSILIPFFITQFKNMGGSADYSGSLPQFSEDGKIKKNVSSSSSETTRARVDVGTAPQPVHTTSTKTRALKASFISDLIEQKKQNQERAQKAFEDQNLVAVDTGGLWLGQDKQLKIIDFFGELIPVKDFNFIYTHDPEQMTITVFLPQSFLDQIQVSKLSRFYKSDNEWRDLKQVQEYTPDKNYSDYSESQLQKNSERQEESTRRQRVRERINKDLPF